jgi:hypothetical protein
MVPKARAGIAKENEGNKGNYFACLNCTFENDAVQGKVVKDLVT